MGVQRLSMRGVYGRYYARLDALTALEWAPKLVTVIPTDQPSEEIKWLGMTPALREWVGGRMAKGLRETGITIKTKLFEGTVELNVDEFRRDKSGQMLIRIGELAGRTAEHPAKLLSSLIEAPGTGYDGTPFFGTTHVEGASGTQKNDFVAADISELNVVTPANPTVAEMELIIPKVIEKALAVKDDQGEPMNANARTWLLMVPANMWAASLKALTLPIIVDGSASRSNLIANVQAFGHTIGLVMNPRLTQTAVIFVFRQDSDVKPFLMLEELFELGDEDQTFMNNRVLFGVKVIRNVGTGYWQYAFRATLS